MIRKRNPRTDDRAIFALIRRELMPYTRKAFPDFKFDRGQMVKRFKHGITLISADGREKKPHGFVSCFVKKGTLVIDLLAVKNSHQGKGIGSALLKRAERWGMENGCRESVLLVDRRNTGAYRFYERNGYREVRPVPSQQCYMMGKSLDVTGKVRCCAN